MVLHTCKMLWVGLVSDSFFLLKSYLRKYHLNPNPKYDNILKLKDSHKGERCFIVATGPSLTIDDMEKIKHEYVFCVNSIVKIMDKLSYVPNAIGIQDKFVFEKIGKDIEESSFPLVLITDELFEKITNKTTKYAVFSKYSARHAFWNLFNKPASGFSDDIYQMVYDGYSITYSLLQIAVYMGFEEIYILGCDCSYADDVNKRHFVNYGLVDKNAQSNALKTIYCFQLAKEHLEKTHPGVKVYNSTRGGKLEVFQRLLLDEINLKQSNV